MFTFGLCGIGSIYDLITLSKQVREANLQKAILDNASRPDNYNQLVNKKEKIEYVVLKIAKSNKGIITASELALAAKAPLEEAKKTLNNMVSKGYAELRVRQSGSIVYTIPDLMDDNVPLID